MKKSTNKILLSLILAASMLSTLGAPKLVQAAEATINMGTTTNFAILAGQTVTNTGSTEIIGDIGLHPGTALTSDTVLNHTGTEHLTDAVALDAKNDLVTAYNDAAGRTPEIIGSELGGQILTPGVYTSESKKFELTGKLTLDGEGDPDAIFIFQTDSTLITASNSEVVLTGAATACDIFWKVGSSATLGTDSIFKGSILASESITLDTGAEVRGQLLASNGSVTLDSNVITSGPCTRDLSITLNIIKLVVNEDDATAVAGDFTISVLKDDQIIEGSTSIGMDAPGKAYTLEPGNYSVAEEAVEGYVASYSGDSTDGKITLKAGDKKTIIITNTYTEATIGSIEITKYDDADNLLPGAEFTLYQNDVKVGDPEVTDENGKIVFAELPLGDYTVKETGTPEGYIQSDLMEEVSITEEKVVELKFINTKIMGTVSITKVDSKTEAALAGAGFRITNSAGTEVFNGKTDDKGMLLAELPYGKYIIEETVAPENYDKTDTKYSVDITENGQVFTLVVKNTMTEENSAVLPEAEDTTPEGKGDVLPKAGDTAETIFLFAGVLAITGGILLMRKKQIA